VAAELGTFRVAATHWFEDEGVRQMLRTGGRSGSVHMPLVVPEQQPAVDRVAELTATLRQGERAGDSLARRQAESERRGQRRGSRS